MDRLNLQIKDSIKVYNLLEDEISKKIYELRMMYSLTGSSKYVDELIGCTSAFQWLKKEILSISLLPIFIYGAGDRGRLVARCFSVYCTGVIDLDRNKHGSKLEGLEIYSLEEVIKKYGKEIAIIVTPKFGNDEIINELNNRGITRIINLKPKIEELLVSSYFDLPQLKRNDNEVFVDCGAYDGDSALGFVKWCNNKFEHIYLFEPDKKNIKLCDINLSQNISNEKYTIIEKGNWSTRTQLRFDVTGDVSTHATEKGTEILDVSSIDEEIMTLNKVTYIKMDIEGAELEALKGAERVITRDFPNLAICVYHKPEDIFTIPQYINSLVPEKYKFYLRHYTLTKWDTVLYAVPVE